MTRPYTDFKNQYDKYFEILEILGNHYFGNNDFEGPIYLTIDENELDRLFNEVLEVNESGLSYLVKKCSTVLNSPPSIYDELIEIEKSWQQDGCPGYPPQLCFVVLFIIAATRMGTDPENIDWRNYYEQLLILMDIEMVQTTFENKFREGFVSKQLFHNLSNWIENNFGSASNTFSPSDSNSQRIHQSWILNQSLFNKKDLNLLNSFFKYLDYEPNDEISPSFVFAKFKDFLITENNSSSIIKARSFSAGLRNSIQNDNFIERVTNTLENKFLSWDGSELNQEGDSVLDFIHRLSFDEENKKIIEIKGILDFSILENFDISEFKIKAKENDGVINVQKNNMLNFYQTEYLENIYFDNHSWEIEGLDINQKLDIKSPGSQIMILKYVDSDIFTNKSWEEIKKTDYVDESLSYTIICLPELFNDVKDYLIMNSNYLNSPDSEIYNISDSNSSVHVFKNITFNQNRTNENNNPALSIFSERKTKNNRLQLEGGLYIDRHIYLNEELPSLIVPENYVEDLTITLKINTELVTFEFKEAPFIISPISYIEYIGNENTVVFEHNYRDIYLDKIKFIIKNHWDAINTPNVKTLGYELNYDSLGNFNFNKVIPTEIGLSDNESAYLSGGQLYLPVASKTTTRQLINFRASDTEIILIGKNSNVFLKFKKIVNEISWIEYLDIVTSIYFFNTSSGDMSSTSLDIQTVFKPFTDIEKIVDLPNLTWQINYGENNKVIQHGTKLPKGFESSEEHDVENQEKWANAVINVKEEMLEDIDKQLWEKYLAKARKVTD